MNSNQKLNQINNSLQSSFEKIEFMMENGLYDEAIYSTLFDLEYATYNFGIIVHDYESEKTNNINESDLFEPLSDEEKETLSFKRFLNKHCNCNFSFETIADGGYRVILPYLLSRRATKGIEYSVKRKYIVGVFKKLLDDNIQIIKQMKEATIIIVSYSPNDTFTRDNDNADAHDIINLINKYILQTDDNGALVNVFFDSDYADCYKTEVIILPKIGYKNLIKWVTK